MEDEVPVLSSQSHIIEIWIEPCEFSPYPHTFFKVILILSLIYVFSNLLFRQK